MSEAMAKIVAVVKEAKEPVRIGELVLFFKNRGWATTHVQFVLGEAIKAGKIQRDGCWVELP